MNSHIIRNSFFILFFLLVGLGFSQSYITYTIDNLDFVIALGVDVADSDDSKVKVSFEFGKVSNSSSDDNGSAQSKSIINTVEADSIDSAINLMNVHMGKELKLSHCKLVVFSEAFAEKGISNEIYTLVNNVQIRPTANVVVSKCDTKYYLENSIPSIENYITKYYEIFPNSGKYTGYTANTTISNFFEALSTNTFEAVAILGGISDSNTASYKNVYDVKSGSSPISSDRKAENIGLAVFKNDKLVGELSAIESLAYSILTNQVDSFLVSIPNPDDNSQYLDIYLYDDLYTSSTVSIVNNTPYISVDIKLTGGISSTSYNSKYLDSDYLNEISTYTSSYIESFVADYLYKTAKDYKSDINNIGKEVLRNFVTWSDFENYNWKDRYKDAFFDVHVDADVASGYLITET